MLQSSTNLRLCSGKGRHRRAHLYRSQHCNLRGWNNALAGATACGAGTAGGLSQFECQPPGPFTGPGNCPAPGVLDLTLGNIYGIDQNGNIFDENDPLNPDHPYTGPLGDASGFRLNPDGTLGYNDRQSGYLSLPLERWSLFASTSFDLVDVAGGKFLGSVVLNEPGVQNQVNVDLAPDGNTVAVFRRAKNEIVVYDVPGAAGTVAMTPKTPDPAATAT